MITRLPYKLIFIVPSILIVLLICFANDKGSIVYAPVGVMISAIAALTAATVTIKSSRHTFMQTNSLSFQQSLQGDKHYKESLIVVSKAMNNRLSIPLKHYAIASNIKTNEDREILSSIRYVLNSWEQAASSCRHHLYDEKHLYESHKSMVIELGLQFRNLIHEIQEVRNNPDIYKNFTWLVLHWTIRRDDFMSIQTKKELVNIYRQLNSVRAGKLPRKRHRLKSFR